MLQQSTQTSAFRPQIPTVQFENERCPSCEQTIPPEKLEEIRGKIAARERAQTLALTAQLQEQYAFEKAEADSKAKADLESERRQSAAREARAVEDASRSSDERMKEKIAEAEAAHLEGIATRQREIADAEAARKLAEQAGERLKAELEASKNEANEREAAIRIEAVQSADLAAADRIAGIEAARKESEQSLHARLHEAEQYRVAAEESRISLASQLDALQKAKDLEIAKLKEDAASEAARVRKDATEAAEARLQKEIASHRQAVVEANTKAQEAEGKTLLLAEQHASALNDQREILEKAKDDALNAERAKAFADNQNWSTKVNELQRALEKKNSEDLGEGAEVDLFEALKAEFPDDDIKRIAKGVAGADIRHIVMSRGQSCGTILYDSKNHKQHRSDHVTKLRADQLADKAEHAILSTHKFPEGTGQICVRDGVILANPARVASIALIIRQHLLHVHTLRMGAIERESKTEALYEFITSEHCASLLGRIDERANDLLKRQEKEIEWHRRNWNNQGEAIKAIQKAKVDLENQISAIVGTSMDEIAAREAS